ncbi:methyltransferase-domain-containing protein [Dimargaris cristalligena]|uniref:Ribosomal RNA-processing protein 8 n=1 Tax=Dimargaris cristalligena TaxID=215637 RepID=A0A4P9ZVH4_9FUNG|nr:methyltransferase-domain-containing protein [Dimargaris cristalligena]|eukprot:RKP36842.1 methyltransferase-domain-containing protein [Dimargaris cristalligena]
MSVHQRQMAKKLQGARFRWINEQLYTAEGSNSYDLFQKQPQTFNDYHLGFRAQVEHWPSNPVDIYIADLAKRPTTLVVADMGCGEAKLAQSVPQKVHSFDLVAGNEYITACDIAHTPLPNEEVDLVIFCLALMGTNFLDFIQEAHRILKPNGNLWIAEVISRFTNIGKFVKTLTRMGFRLLNRDDSNKMFIQFEFQKIPARQTEGELDGPSDKPITTVELLKPCIYKRR